MTGTAQPARSFATASITREAAAAVTDAGGHLTVFERMDGGPLLTGEVAINKAWTAASYGVATHDWNRYVADSKVAPLANIPRLMPVGGGNPVKDGGKLVGGIGVSGGNAQQDQDIAEAALNSLGFDVADAVAWSHPVASGTGAA